MNNKKAQGTGRRAIVKNMLNHKRVYTLKGIAKRVEKLTGVSMTEGNVITGLKRMARGGQITYRITKSGKVIAHMVTSPVMKQALTIKEM